ncbi:hypothetical protein [Flavihumibacter solisilvae]|uniref:Uncharacterized protein n=1 Tax=Flavihumibacter solisilvae TaxID=1349421 RepID=A0A0C1KY85_9BACT|nr:hypothetical protein [Flavihumibacter solisilvae]KIC92662.1 hypothetical protein OI18_21640 [Flavihumibacter solisilvae]
MRTSVFAFLLMALFSCRKDDDKPADNSPATSGKWIRGIFDLSSFWTYGGESIIPGSYSTDGLVIHDDGTLEWFTVFFPTDPRQGCNPQKLMYKKGNITFSDNTQRFTMTFTEGRYREFYQDCPGKTNHEEILASTELANMSLSGYWKIESSQGRKLLGIAYASASGPYLYLEEGNW